MLLFPKTLCKLCFYQNKTFITEVPSLGIHFKGGEFLFIAHPLTGQQVPQLHLKDYGWASGAVVAVIASVKKRFVAELISLITN